MVGLAKASEILQRLEVTLYRWLADGFIVGEQLTVGGPWHIRLTDAPAGPARPAAPEGWVGLDQAAKALGVARQTVLHRVQRGSFALCKSPREGEKACVSR